MTRPCPHLNPPPPPRPQPSARSPTTRWSSPPPPPPIRKNSAPTPTTSIPPNKKPATTDPVRAFVGSALADGIFPNRMPTSAGRSRPPNRTLHRSFRPPPLASYLLFCHHPAPSVGLPMPIAAMPHD